MRHPSWLKTKIPSGRIFTKVQNLIKDNNLNTVCIEANCPNRGECFSKGTATFMIMGNTCTRNCLYCDVTNAKPKPLDVNEPLKIARAINALNLKYAVITSVTRDDLPDYGANHFFDTVKEIKSLNPNCKVEILTPDFNGDIDLLKLVLISEPFVFNHNIEVVEELFLKVRSQGNYETSLKVLKNAKINRINNNLLTKSGFMVGLGETISQIHKTIRDLKESQVDILTVGQYLQPRNDLAVIKKYYTPSEFKDIENYAKKVGIKYIFSAPLVRSSYNASELHGI